MNVFRPLASLDAFRPLASFVCASCRRAQPSNLPSVSSVRTITSTSSVRAFGDDIDKFLDTAVKSRESLNGIFENVPRGASGRPPPTPTTIERAAHRLHIYSTKHNTHITFTQPPKKDPANPSKTIDVLLSLSAGNIGFKKAGRGSYDAGYQLTAFVLKQIQERGLLRDLHELEIVFRGFGKGRDAVSKALLGQEGYMVRNKIKFVKDATRLKFGGTRSPKPRRLG